MNNQRMPELQFHTLNLELLLTLCKNTLKRHIQGYTSHYYQY